MTIKKWISEHKGLVAIASTFGLSAIVIFVWSLGKHYGENQLIELLIHNCENGDNPVYISSDKKLGGLMYEIYAECIGD